MDVSGDAQLKTSQAEVVAKQKWNAQADQYNQWDELGGDEKLALIAAEETVLNSSSKGACASSEAVPIAAQEVSDLDTPEFHEVMAQYRAGELNEFQFIHLIHSHLPPGMLKPAEEILVGLKSLDSEPYWVEHLANRTDYPSPRDRGFFDAGINATSRLVASALAGVLEVADGERKRIAGEYQRRQDENSCEVGGHVNRQWAHLEGAVKVVAAIRKFLQAPAVGSKQQATPEWRCFHCDATFTDRAEAQNHFGRSERQTPACQLDESYVRSLESELQRYREEDTDLHRQIAGHQPAMAAAQQRAEEVGYARGLKDAGDLSAACISLAEHERKISSMRSSAGTVAFRELTRLFPGTRTGIANLLAHKWEITAIEMRTSFAVDDLVAGRIPGDPRRFEVDVEAVRKFEAWPRKRAGGSPAPDSGEEQ